MPPTTTGLPHPKTEFPVGTVASATVRHTHVGVLVMKVRCNSMTLDRSSTIRWVSCVPIDGNTMHREYYLSNIQPVGVLDIPNRTMAEDIARVLRDEGYGQHADALLVQIPEPVRIPEPTKALACVVASTKDMVRRRFYRGVDPESGTTVRCWVDGERAYAWHELLDPVLADEGRDL